MLQPVFLQSLPLMYHRGDIYVVVARVIDVSSFAIDCSYRLVVFIESRRVP